MLQILFLLFLIIAPLTTQADLPPITCEFLNDHIEAYAYCTEAGVCQPGVAVTARNCMPVYKNDLDWNKIFSEISNKNLLKSGAGTYNIKIDSIVWVTKISASSDCMSTFLNFDFKNENPGLLGNFCEIYDRHSNKEELYNTLLSEKIKRDAPPSTQEILLGEIKSLIPILFVIILISFGISRFWKRKRF